jgi:hypothetical protein
VSDEATEWLLDAQAGAPSPACRLGIAQVASPHRIEWLSPREVRVYEGELEAAADLDGIYGRDEWRWGEGGTVDIIVGPGEWRTVATFEELERATG